MGIGLSRESWSTVVAKNHADEEKRLARGARPRFFTPPQLPSMGNIKTSPTAEEFIAAHRIPRMPGGAPVVSTDRGRRRNARPGKASGKTP